MKLPRKILSTLLIIIILLIGVGMFVSGRMAKSGLVDYSANAKLKNLSAPVEVFRDGVGKPTLIAENEADLYRATGYVMAQERMWQMDLLRRVTLGRLSEIFGEKYVDIDLLLRSLRYSKKSKEILTSESDTIIGILEAFSDGVNQYIEQYKDNYPAEFKILGYEPEPWEPYHSLNLIGYMAWDLKSGWEQFMLHSLASKLDSAHFSELLPDVSKQGVNVFSSEQTEELMANISLKNFDKLHGLGLDILFGSNNWAVSGAKSTTGQPILANDMHLEMSIPGIWLQMNQVVKGGLHVSGLALPGQPMIIVGHNDSIAWGMTNTYVDNLDFYEEKIHPTDSNKYQMNGNWHNFEVHDELIKCKGDKEFKKTFRTNHRGPVVSQSKKIKDKVLTIKWMGDVPSNEIMAVYKINRANNWADFKDAFSHFKAISQNIAYADVKGNIGLYCCAGVPIRKRAGVLEILPGWTNEYDWAGFVPFEELPHEYNPDRGYVSSANNSAIDNNYPYHIGTWYSMPYRMMRIRELLESKESYSVEDFKTIQTDALSVLGRQLAKEVFVLVNSNDVKEKHRNLLQSMLDWDGDMDKSKIEPAIAEYFMNFLIEAVYADEIGEEFSSDAFDAWKWKLYRTAFFNLLDNHESVWVDNINTTEEEDFATVVTQSFNETIKYLEKNYTRESQNWKWGNIHVLTLEHPLGKVQALNTAFKLNRGPYPTSGSYHTIAPYSYSLGQPYKIKHGASHRHIYTLHNWDNTVSVLPTGNSGVIRSEFYCDQTQAFVEGKYFGDFYTIKAVAANARYSMRITPE